MAHRDSYYADGAWHRSAAGSRLEIVNPATEEVIGSVPDCTPEEVNLAVHAAAAAFAAWSARPAAERAALLDTLAQRLKARTEEIAALISTELGMPLRMSRRMQVPLPVGALEAAAKIAASHVAERRVANSLVVKEPVGVVACITPWNYPLYQIMTKIAPALGAGCTVVLKPSEVAPSAAFVLAEEIHASGFPPGVFNLVTGLGAGAGEQLAAHPAVNMVSFTGSTAAGKRVAAVAAGTVKRVALELGGKSAAVVLPGADLAMAVKNTVNVCFLNSGQTCSALTRLLVPREQLQEACEMASAAAASFTVGDPFSDASKLGPLANLAQYRRVRNFIEAAAVTTPLVAGGTQRPEGLDKGFYVRPTVFGPVDPDSDLAQQEVFGPVLSIIAYTDADDAVRIANGTPYGLAAAVWAASDEEGLRFARRLQAGQVDVNGAPFNPMAPFGGYKQSGVGRENGVDGFEEFLETKSVQLRQAA